MKSTLALLPLLFAAAPAPEAAVDGPPCICFQLDIGAQVSLPWGQGPFAVDEGYDRARVVTDVEAHLRGNDDLVYRMETVRRAVIYVTGLGSGERRPAAEVRQGRDALLALLRRDALARLADPQAAAARRAAGWLTVGFAQAAFHQAGFEEPGATRDGHGGAALEAALRLQPEDAYMAFGAGLGLYVSDRAGAHRALARAAAAAEQDARLRGLMIGTAGQFLGAQDFPELQRKLQDAVAKDQAQAALEPR